MARTIEAVYENGVFKPLQKVNLEEGQRVQVHIPYEPDPAVPPDETLEQKLRRLGFQAFADVPDEEWEKISEGWKRG